ncbi:MAG: hypothetical protein ACYSYL_00705 [Planctomycetota bacterium]|jgi:hypothetical protein
MLSANKLKELCQQQQMNVEQLADQLARPGLDKKESVVAVRNWQKGLFKPKPRADDIRR